MQRDTTLSSRQLYRQLLQPSVPENVNIAHCCRIPEAETYDLNSRSKVYLTIRLCPIGTTQQAVLNDQEEKANDVGYVGSERRYQRDEGKDAHAEKEPSCLFTLPVSVPEYCSPC